MSMIPLGLMGGLLGNCFVTRLAASRLNRDDAMVCLERHMVGDYGEVDAIDWMANDEAAKHGFPIVSLYVDRRKHSFLIITDADRSATTILLPEEY